MTWIVNWDGREYDIDPAEFTGLEMAAIKQRAGFTYRQLMTEALPEFDGDAIRALFWTVDRRASPDLKFSEYAGPPIKVFRDGFVEFGRVLDELGKAIPQTPATSGSLSSPTTSDGPGPSTTS
jgi:hypothetical protein